MQILTSILGGVTDFSEHRSPFVERFKYDVISSSLLSSTISVPHAGGSRSVSPIIPGRLTRSNSRTHSDDDNRSLDVSPDVQGLDRHASNTLAIAGTEDWTIMSAFAVVAVIFNMGYYLISVLSLGGAMYYLYQHKSDKLSKPDMNPVSVLYLYLDRTEIFLTGHVHV